ncbi:MAG TPA: ChbG/HpnK family deacetylase, partial [Candidatus Hydrogenedentes bacterium]|nr:ChbG/HpnK family deacetylase [Candidatus Hydrogenedentota bacterium]
MPMLRVSVQCVVFALCCLTAGLPAFAEQEPTYAERLGWPKGSKVVIFHIDDAGMCHDANVGVIEALEKGVSTSTSIMMPCGWVPEFTAYIETHPDVDAGIHLTLTSEWDNYRWKPLAGVDAVPGLCDGDGYLWGNVAEVVEHAGANEVELELRAQIDAALRMGIKPTHLDSHMGTLFSSPLFFHRYIKVGKEYGIPILAPGGHLTYILQEMPEQLELVRNIAQQVWDSGFPVIDDVVAATYDWKSFEEKKGKILHILRTMPPGITEIIQH